MFYVVTYDNGLSYEDLDIYMVMFNNLETAMSFRPEVGNLICMELMIWDTSGMAQVCGTLYFEGGAWGSMIPSP